MIPESEACKDLTETKLRAELYKRVPAGLSKPPRRLAAERSTDRKKWHVRFRDLVELCNMEVEVLKQGEGMQMLYPASLSLRNALDSTLVTVRYAL